MTGFELCPECGQETDFNIDKAERSKGWIVCSHCGAIILACSICTMKNECNEINCFEYDRSYR